MIAVTKDHEAVPEKLRSPKCKEKIEQALKEKGQHKFSTYYYRDPQVLEQLRAIYRDKCCFCESIPRPASVEQVDHYRPKSEVQDQVHPGYYWLGYEWSNLLLICPACNRKKSSHFPLETEAARVRAPHLINGTLDLEKCRANGPTLLEEKPLLLHPEQDNPLAHLGFYRDGSVRGLTSRGRKTIEICGLDRQDLTLARRKVVDDLVNEINGDVKKYLDKEISQETLEHCLEKVFLRLWKGQEAASPYTQFHRFIFHYFDNFILEVMGGKERRLVKGAFAKFKQKKGAGD